MLIAPEDLARPASIGAETGDGARELRGEVRARLGVERVVLASAGEVDVRADEEVGVGHQGAASLQNSECDEHKIYWTVDGDIPRGRHRRRRWRRRRGDRRRQR